MKQKTTQGISRPFKTNFKETAEGTITRTGVIFRAGDYPSHGFTLTSDEMMAAIENFEPVSIDLEHTPTLLDKKLGMLTDVTTLDDMVTLVGTVELPAWLDKALEDRNLTVSTTWLEFDDGSKRIGGLALTGTPAIKDAVLFSAYTAFSGQRHSSADMKDIQAIHDMATKQGADCGNCPKCGASMNNFTQSGGKKMGFFSKLLGGRKAEDMGLTPEELAVLSKLDGAEPEVTATLLSTGPDPRVEALEKELAAQKAQFSQLAEDKRRDKASALVDSFITAGKLWPYERLESIASLVRDMEDDEASPRPIEFTDAKGAVVRRTREQARTLQFSARVPHGLTEEKAKAVFALPNAAPEAGSETPEQHAAKLAEMMATTPAGREALAEAARAALAATK